MSKKTPKKQGIVLKKKFGQHFLQSSIYIDRMLENVQFDDHACVFEIGCGEGILTQGILQQPLKKLWVFEIDEQWAELVQNKHKNDERLTVFHENILQADLEKLHEEKSWILLANLPYNITFPILHLLYQHKSVVREGVVMMQEEVAQKILKTSGRGYGYPSLFFQHYFNWKLLEKIPPEAFFPPPKVYSRLLYFQTRENPEIIPDEINFWKFIKVCFHQPRRTLRNNLAQGHYDINLFSADLLEKRAQELIMADFLTLWKSILVA